MPNPQLTSTAFGLGPQQAVELPRPEVSALHEEEPTVNLNSDQLLSESTQRVATRPYNSNGNPQPTTVDAPLETLPRTSVPNPTVRTVVPPKPAISTLTPLPPPTTVEEPPATPLPPNVDQAAEQEESADAVTASHQAEDTLDTTFAGLDLPVPEESTIGFGELELDLQLSNYPEQWNQQLKAPAPKHPAAVPLDPDTSSPNLEHAVSSAPTPLPTEPAPSRSAPPLELDDEADFSALQLPLSSGPSHATPWSAPPIPRVPPGPRPQGPTVQDTEPVLPAQFTPPPPSLETPSPPPHVSAEPEEPTTRTPVPSRVPASNAQATPQNTQLEFDHTGVERVIREELEPISEISPISEMREPPPLSQPLPLPPLEPPPTPPATPTPQPPAPSTRPSPSEAEADLRDAELHEEEDPISSVALRQSAPDVFDAQLPVPPEYSPPRGLGSGSGRPTYRPRQRALGLLIGTCTALGIMGVALGAFTNHGYFGRYFLERFLPAASHPSRTATIVEQAEALASRDTFQDTREALAMLGTARHSHGLDRPLLTRSLLHESLAVIRFGPSVTNPAHAPALLRRLEERGGKAPGMALARAANAARLSEWQVAKQWLQRARQEAPQDPYVDVVAGEVYLALGEGAAAQAAFASALAQGAGTRAHWGLARAHAMQHATGPEHQAVAATLDANPLHAEARIARAHHLFAEGEIDQALQELEQAVGLQPVDGARISASPRAQAGGFAAIGQLREAKGHLHQARTAYDSALQLDPSRAEALIGAGRVMLRERRFSDALARFEAASNEIPKGQGPTMLNGRTARTEAEFGRAQALLALNKVDAANRTLATLRESLPDDPDIINLLGKIRIAQGRPKRAEDLFRRAVALAPSDFHAYLALAELYDQQERPELAAGVLEQAAQYVPESAEMQRMLGQSDLRQQALDDAIEAFERALALNPQDTEARFGLGQALRLNGDHTRAAQVLAEVERNDPNFAGLSREKGLLAEAQNDYEAVITHYRNALMRQADDPELLLRLGGAYTEIGELEQAEQILSQVNNRLPNSAEVAYYLGRVALGRDDLIAAQTHFHEALTHNPDPAVYHLYAGRAALAADDLDYALQAAETALEKTPNLVEAEWLKGLVHQKQGRCREALQAFRAVVAADPERLQAYVATAECHVAVKHLRQAEASLRAALDKDPTQGQWWYMLAQIALDRGRRREAAEHIRRALPPVASEDDAKDRPWLPDAYLTAGDIARANRNRRKARQHYKHFLSIAPADHPRRAAMDAQLRP